MNSLKIKTITYQAEKAAIIHIRTKVFQEEQGVAAELEFDGLDAEATQLLAFINGKPIGTTRIRAIDYNTAKIERLAVLSEARNQGVGTQLMLAALDIIHQQNKTNVIVHAQQYIAPLYQKLGFTIVGEKFSEAGIAHVKMVKQLMQND